jgi:hypothetical protein
LVRGTTKARMKGKRGRAERGMEMEEMGMGMGMGKVDEKAWQRHYRCRR